MKYVIREIGNSPSYLRAENYALNRTSTFTRILADATKFDSIRDAIDVIRLRDGIYFSAPRTPFTIVGLEEVSTPTYREVAL